MKESEIESFCELSRTAAGGFSNEGTFSERNPDEARSFLREAAETLPAARILAGARTVLRWKALAVRKVRLM